MKKQSQTEQMVASVYQNSDDVFYQGSGHRKLGSKMYERIAGEILALRRKQRCEFLHHPSLKNIPYTLGC